MLTLQDPSLNSNNKGAQCYAGPASVCPHCLLPGPSSATPQTTTVQQCTTLEVTWSLGEVHLSKEQ